MRPESGRYLVRSRSKPESPGSASMSVRLSGNRPNVARTNRLPDFDGTGIEVVDPWAPANATPASPARPES